MKPFHVDVKRNKYHYNIYIDKRLIVILGDSSTGKTMLTEIHSKSDAVVTSPYKLLTVSSQNIEFISETKDRVLLVDLDNMEDSTVIDSLMHLDVVSNNLYIVVFGRNYLNRISLPLSAIYRFVNVKGITKNERVYDNEISYLTGNIVNYYVTEDSGSGFSFMKQVNPNTKCLSGASKYTKLPNDRIVVFFDSLGFGAYIGDFLDYCKKNTNIEYVLWSSFEHFLLKNVFNIDVEFDALNLEEQCAKLLNKVTNGWYSKHNGCCGAACCSCPNSCKNLDCKSILFKAYPMLKNTLPESSIFDIYVSKLNLNPEEQHREYERLQKLADDSGCSIDDIIKDLL